MLKKLILSRMFDIFLEKLKTKLYCER